MIRKSLFVLLLLLPVAASAQYQEAPSQADSTLVLTLDDALRIALSENIAVKVADLEVTRQEYAQKGSYSSLFPQINASGSFQRTLKKQVMYMGGGSSSGSGSGSGSGGGMASMLSGALDPINYYIQELMKQHPGAIAPYTPPATDPEESSSNGGGIEVGRNYTWSAGVNAQLPIVNFQLWESLAISGDQVELAVEQARESRLGMVASVKQAYYAVLLAKAAYDVYDAVYQNAVENYKLTEMRYNAQKASELDFTRAKSSLASAIPNLFNADHAIEIALWQLKAVIGLDLDKEIDVAGFLDDYAQEMFRDITEGGEASLEHNSQMIQLQKQAEMLSRQIRMQQYAYIPTLSLAFAYNYNAMAEDLEFKNYNWTPYSYVGLSLNIPIFSGFQRYHSIKQTRVQARELELQRTNAERQLRIAIRQSISSMDTAMKTYDAAKDALESAEKAFDIALKSYQVGKSTLTDLNNTELVLTQTRLQVSQAVYSFILAKAGLEQTLGYDYTEEKQ
ncbi:MAG: TolC family protein [Bacteroidales bacterium]|nr:TolC family protein [Bacteroidales bacterium]